MTPIDRTIALVLTSMVLVSAIPSVDAERTERAQYLPSLVVVGIACSGEQHDWVPTYTPDEETLLNNPVGWALSGEPECAPSDLMNMARGSSHPTGFGAVAFRVHTTDVSASATTYDDVFGPGDSWLTLRSPASEKTLESETSEGCGPQSVVFPSDMYVHYPPEPFLLLWAFVDEAGVEEDLSRICFASTGIVEATIH